MQKRKTKKHSDSRGKKVKTHLHLHGTITRIHPDGSRFRQRKGRNGSGGYVQ